MAKKIINSYYTFDAANDRVTIPGHVKAEELLLITDVRNNKIIYNFADNTKGYDSVHYDTIAETTRVTLSTDVSALGSVDSSELQIIVDKVDHEVTVADALLDPVHKIRVSTPENLIDTDFEYGLQPTKWETLETSNNVPSFYVSEGDLALTIVSKIDAVVGSDIITVTCTEAHGLAIGTPIDVQGLTSRTAEGKYLIKSADTNTFTYKSNAPQGVTGEIGSIYSTITPGTFYTGSEISFDRATGLSSSADSNSSITITTDDPHGFTDGSNFYLVNTVGAKTFSLTNSADSDAADGRAYVDDSDTVSATITPDLSKTVTTQIRARHHRKFVAGDDVNTTNNRITWPNHGMQSRDVVVYLKPSGDQSIGGLTSFTPYFVKKVDDNNIELAATRDGATISLTSTGTDNYGYHSLHMVYQIAHVYVRYRSYSSQHYSAASQYGNAYSGWDIRTGQMLGSGNVAEYLTFTNDNNYIYYYSHYYSYKYFGPYFNSNMTFGDTGTTPKAFNIFEDYTRMSTGSSGWSLNSSGYWSSSKYYWRGTYSRYPNNTFMIPVVYEEEADTFYNENHGLSSGNTIDYSITSGNAIQISNSTTSRTNTNAPLNLTQGSYAVEKVNDNRFRLSGYRIDNATGTYEFDGVFANATKNSFYIPDHGLAPDTEVQFNLGNGASLPTSTSGVVAPNWSIDNTTSTLPVAYSTLSAAFDDYMTTNSVTMQDMVTYNSDGSSRVIGTGVNSGASPMNYYDLYYTTHTAYSSNIGNVNLPSSNFRVSGLSQTSPVNLVAGTNLNTGGRSYSMVATDFASNTTLDKYMFVTGIKRNNTSEAWYKYFRDGFSFPSAGSFRSRSGNVNQSRTVSGSGNNYRFATEYFCHTITNGPNINYLRIKFKNYSDWASYTSNTYLADTTNGNTYWYAQSSTSSTYWERDELEVGFTWMTDNAETWGSNSDFNALANAIIDYFDANFVYPALSDATNYRVNVLSNDRFSLKKNGVEINLTDGGTSPFDFKTQGVLGIVDGAYTAGSTTENNIVINTNVKVEGQTVGMDPTVADDTITVLDNGTHAFISGTEVTYTSGAGAIGGLTDGGTYYVSVVDDQNFKLCTTEDDAVAGTDFITLTSGSGTGHSVNTSSLAGIVKAEGTVDIVAESNEIKGNETLFKRYFKAGDRIYIKDDNNTPGELYSYIVTTVADDSLLTIDRPADFSTTGTNHYVESKVYARPDGYAVHRPFDGGVEIAAGTAPFSHICRQTRKYFRYQSGKGIQTSLAINFNPPVTLEGLVSNSGTIATATTKYPHRLEVGSTITVKDASDDTYNGDQTVESVIDDFTFTYDMEATPVASFPSGIIKYNMNGYSGAKTRAGMFDFQNGFFFEFDGNALHCVRRSSTTQLSGSAAVNNGSGKVEGTKTQFLGQLSVGDRIVLRGQSYKVVKINSNTELYVQPAFRGITTAGIIMTKTEDVRVPQSAWNLDRVDGTGPEGFILDINKIQMAYMDYSWYGAGKIRFGFKDRLGHVRYVHEFIHNNRLDEAYMRSGNLPAKYEIENDENPTYAPTLFHWGTSVIMDGTFDDDKAYLFTAPSKSLSFTNGESSAITTNGNSALTYQWNWQQRRYDWYVRLPFASADASNFYSGLKMYTSGGELDGEEVSYTQYSGNTFYVYIYIQTSRNQPGSYPVVSSGTSVSLGVPASGASGDDINLGTDTVPLVSLRLAPSVDGNLTGNLGERDIINRMQLKLNEVGLILTHDCEVKLILNGDLSNINWENVKNPSLSQLIRHEANDTVSGGTEIFSFRASGGTTDNTGKRLSNTSDFKLADIIDLGNSIMGGNGTFPNGPDVLTVAVQVVDTGGIGADNPFKTSARITWSESQA